MKNTTGLREVLVAEFNSIFYDEEPKELDQYLKGISRSMILDVGTFFLSFSNKNSDFVGYKDFLSKYFGSANNSLANILYKRFRAVEENQRINGRSVEIQIINPESSLQLIEFGFENLTEEETQSRTDAETNIFKAYLMLNQKNILKDDIAHKSTQNLHKNFQILASTFSQSFPYSDLINYDKFEIIIGQVIKSIYLFEFLESNNKTKELLSEFLEYFKVDNWNEYLMRILPIMFSSFKVTDGGYTDIEVTKDDAYDISCEFIDKLIVKDEEVIADYDYKKIRSKPLYKISEGKYRIIFPLFVWEMIYKGLYFKLNEINTSMDKKISNFRSFYCDSFSEEYLGYSILNGIYQNRYVEYSGASMKKLGMSAEPDYYIRKGNYAFLFESKDIFIRADIKQSADYSLYERELKKRLYFEENGGKRKNGAILQLLNNIKRLIEKNFKVDRSYKEKSLRIYPVLILHDNQFNCSGLNSIINKWFKDELQKLNNDGLHKRNVRPITIINIDTFILYQDLFRDRTFRLEKVIDDYIKYTTFDHRRKYRDRSQAKEYFKRTLVPFNVFMSMMATTHKIKPNPKMLKEKGYSIFNNN